jgi:molecular chaperone DnaK (HSP70)
VYFNTKAGSNKEEKETKEKQELDKHFMSSMKNLSEGKSNIVEVQFSNIENLLRTEKNKEGEEKEQRNKVKAPSGYNEKVWSAMVDEAYKDKEWAEKMNKDESWKKNASEMSLNSLKEKLSKPIEQLAKESYDYLKKRARAKSDYYGSSRHIDESAKQKWEKLSGEK